MILTDFAQDLAFRAIVLIKVRHWSITARTFAVFTDITFGTSSDRLNWLIGILIAPGKIEHKILIIPRFNIVKNERKLINFKFLIFGRMGIIKSPLLERDIFADKVNKEAVLLIKLLNKFK